MENGEKRRDSRVEDIPSWFSMVKVKDRRR